MGWPKVLYQKKGKIPSVKHEYYVNYLISFFKKNSIRAVPSQIGPDIVIPEMKTAINVELGTSDVEGNMRYALEEFDFVVTCTDNEKVLQKIPRMCDGTVKELVWNVPKIFETKKKLVPEKRIDSVSSD